MRFGPVALGVALLAVACGSDSSKSGGGSPTAPTPPAPAPAGLAITGTETLRTGQTQTYTATLTLSNGTSQLASPTWASDNSDVLTINASGQANAASQGTATITAAAQGLTAKQIISVYQDYQGIWGGTYRVRVCTDQGPLRGVLRCPDVQAGTFGFIFITLRQNAAAASGTVELGELEIPISGGIFPSRRFIGGGSSAFVEDGVTLNVNVGTLDVLSTPTSLTGRIIVSITAVGISGNVYFEGDLDDVTRVFGVAEPRRVPAVDWADDLMRALRAR